MNTPTRLTIMCGLPGSGKSTWAATHHDEDELILSADIVRRRPRMRAPNQILGMQLLAPDHLRRGTSVIIDACSTNPNDRHEWLYLARCARVRTRLVIIDTPTSICIERQRERGRAAVPAMIIRKQAAMLDASRTRFASEDWDDIITIACDPQ